MKKYIMLALVALASSLSVAMAAQKQIRVNTAREFIEALGDNREIVVCSEEALLLTPIIEQLAEEGRLKLYDYASRAPQNGVLWESETDGPQLVLSGIKDLTIRSNSDERRSIEITPRYANVLTFIACSNIKLQNLHLGHTEEGYCSNGVVAFDGCTNVSIDNCGLFGCGTEGLELRRCTGFTMKDSEIFHCSYYIMHIYGSQNCRFERCAFYQNKEYEQVSVDGASTGVLFERCVWTKNQGTLFVLENPDHVILRRCIIQHDGDQGNGYQSADDCIWAY